MNEREPTQVPGLTILSRCSAGLRLVSDRPKAWEWESFPRRAQGPRYRQRALAPWLPELIEVEPLPCDEGWGRQLRRPLKRSAKLFRRSAASDQPVYAIPDGYYW